VRPLFPGKKRARAPGGHCGAGVQELVEDFTPLDQARTKMYRELIEVRQILIETLSPEEWNKVFGRLLL
jgi:hypothetical protein